MDNQNTTQNSDEEKREEVNNYLIPVRKKLYRSPKNSILLGVASGIAEYLNVSPIFIRVLFIFTALLGGWGIIAYAICLFLIPEHPSIKAQGKFSRLSSRKFLGFIIIIIGVYNWIPPFGIFKYIDAYNYFDSILFAMGAIILGLFILVKGKKEEDEVAIPKPKKLYRSKEERRLLGVCKGMATYMDTDVNILRMLWILLSFVTLGSAALFYFIIGYFMLVEESEVIIDD